MFLPFSLHAQSVQKSNTVGIFFYLVMSFGILPIAKNERPSGLSSLMILHCYLNWFTSLWLVLKNWTCLLLMALWLLCFVKILNLGDFLRWGFEVTALLYSQPSVLLLWIMLFSAAWTAFFYHNICLYWSGTSSALGPLEIHWLVVWGAWQEVKMQVLRTELLLCGAQASGEGKGEGGLGFAL